MRVLLVDDVRTQRFLLASLLSHFDCDVYTAEGGESALAIAAEAKPDAVVLDLSMPKMDGYELAKRLRQQAGLTTTKLIALSGLERDPEKLSEAGIDQFLRKPILLQDLQNALGV